jgi:hypothetical protein
MDPRGNVYAAGYISGGGTYTFASAVTAAGTYNGGNVVLVKYDPSGTARWARTVSTGTYTSRFNSVAVDDSGNAYAAGDIYGTGTYTFGADVTAAGPYTGANVVLVKYDPSGVTQWARTVSAGRYTSVFNSVAVDGTWNVYAGGHIYTYRVYNFGGSVRAAGTSSVDNVVLVKYSEE